MTVVPSSGLHQLLSNTSHAARMKGMAIAYARGNDPGKSAWVGTDCQGIPLTEDTLFPVASVTKLATTLLVLRLVDAGRLSIDDPLARHVPEAIAAGHWGVTLRRLLSHTAGLPLDVPREKAPYAVGLTWTSLAEACIQVPLEREPMTRVQYSNVAFGLLGILVERETGQAFSSALDQWVLRPLRVEGYLGVEPPRQPARLSGIRGPHARTDLEPFNSAFWRSLAMPWAGLITTAQGSLALVRAFAGYPAGFLRPALITEATTNQAGEMGGGFVRPLIWRRCPWGLGAELRDDKTPHWAPPEASMTSFGHSGASGCVAWYDPRSNTAWSVHGARTADTGWLIRRAPEVAAAILAATGD